MAQFHSKQEQAISQKEPFSIDASCVQKIHTEETEKSLDSVMQDDKGLKNCGIISNSLQNLHHDNQQCYSKRKPTRSLSGAFTFRPRHGPVFSAKPGADTYVACYIAST